jgi:hypothetical protein
VFVLQRTAPKPANTANTRKMATTGMGEAAAVGAGAIRFGFPEINIGSVVLLTVSMTLSATFPIRLIFGPRIRGTQL